MFMAKIQPCDDCGGYDMIEREGYVPICEFCSSWGFIAPVFVIE
jgi:hypothetical protein|tara:strand:+ start:741 stop:872 length:132 start_codon:yes stop_codon:yes gene_type:complete